ncbi:tRNA lysidine(34) synthetase TilS [Varibaculum vaginae]|uniref:tRNA lysidine(34) synthetase TilS n=1 Tax=Varibaculum vaginae TaxID=2364797 RepID=UPI000F09808E|nr:tRNA lysidine(34) synthetase TilS [Varibaculum vaginae]
MIGKVLGAGGRIERAVLAQLKRLENFQPGVTLLVACSGGPDSLALAAACARLAASRTFKLVAATVDHGWRPESAAQARRVQAMLNGLGYREVTLLELSLQDSGGGKEAAARKGRYQALVKEASRYGKLGSQVFIMLGHTRDDQAETVLLGLTRGSGTRSIAGMRSWGAGEKAEEKGMPESKSSWQTGYLRPLLELPRQDTVAACREWGLPYIDDPSNYPDGPVKAADGSALRRAALRHQGLPALEEALGMDPRPALARTASLLQEDLDALDVLAGTWFTRVKQEESEGINLETSQLLSQPAAIRKRVWRLAALAAGARASDIRKVQLDAVDFLATTRRGIGPIQLPGRVNCTRVSGSYELQFRAQ